MVAVSPYGLSCTVAVRPPACLMVVSVVPLGRATVLTVEPSLAVSVVVTVPSFWVSTTVLEPSVGHGLEKRRGLPLARLRRFRLYSRRQQPKERLRRPYRRELGGGPARRRPA